jgi:hypothetical protein
MSSRRLPDRLIREGKLREQLSGLDSQNGLLSAARRNFDGALKIIDLSEEAAFKCLYDGLLQIGRLILSLHHLRPDDGDQHKTTFHTAGILLGSEFQDLIFKIQKFRTKRNQSIYEPEMAITRADVLAILETARRFWSLVRVHLQKENAQLNLFPDF